MRVRCDRLSRPDTAGAKCASAGFFIREPEAADFMGLSSQKHSPQFAAFRHIKLEKVGLNINGTSAGRGRRAALYFAAIFLYAAASSRLASSPAFATRILIIQPSPYGSLLTASGLA